MSSALDLSHLSLAELKELQRNPDIGDTVRMHIDAAVRSRLGTPDEGSATSTDPRDRMNRTEQRFADLLDMRLRQGEISHWWFESIKLRLADNTHYTPDFVALLCTGRLLVYEVKGGFIREDSRVKFKIAAAQHPWARWEMRQWVDGEWRTVYDFAPRF